jgi:DNA repair protein RecN (Recombination protein N)
MLQQLYIRNYALIREVRLDFSLGFSVMTGETGAGKSILLGALGLVLGDRADSSVLRDAAEKCVVEALFIAPHLSTHPLLQSLELEGESEWCIRREVTANGKSRAFLNDTPVNLTQLQSFTASLVDLHQQFDTLELTETDHQRTLLDAMAGLTEDVHVYQNAYADWRHDLNTLQALESRQMRIKQEQEYDQHILQELRDASFQPEEIESLEEKVRAGDRSEGLTQAIQSVVDRLQGDGENLQQQLRRMQQSLHPFEKTDASIAEWLERMRSVDMEIRELAREMDRAGAGFQFDPRALSDMQERLSLGYRLMKKHGAKHSAELIDLQQRLSEKLAAAETMEAEIQLLQERTQKQEQALRKKSAILHAAREAVLGTWS